MVDVAQYQVLRDGKRGPSHQGDGLYETYWTIVFPFVFPNNLVTNRNRARPIIEFRIYGPRKETRCHIRLGGVSLGQTVTTEDEKLMTFSEVFDWDLLSSINPQAGDELELEFRVHADRSKSNEIRISDVIVWYQVSV